MKTIITIALGFLALGSWTACNRAQGSVRAIDLETGEAITVVEDSSTGKMVNMKTRKPVKLYVDRRSRDTIYGPTGQVVNHHLRMTDEGHYTVAGDFKLKREADGDYKLKDNGYKEKYENGELKIKHGDYKKEVEPDGDVKIKKGDRKIKIDGETGEVKVKN